MSECNTWQCINSFAPWISAFGTILISGIALWLSIKDRRVRVRSRFSLGMLPGGEMNRLNRPVFVLSFVNDGSRKVTVTNHCWKFPFQKRILFMMPNLDSDFGPLCSKLPMQLDHGEEGNAFYDIAFFSKLDKPEEFLFHRDPRVAWIRIRFFKILICTTVGKRSSVSIDKSVRKWLWNQYKKI
ncbi:hypothetical protein [Pectobacterium polaris]|uniref:hypothetical protein n=1 Tax=Pectobacterium polaris TaxID=2042057 RepID=UPI001582B640|nr:hypothetical protein [Pectobacterium polaris]